MLLLCSCAMAVSIKMACSGDCKKAEPGEDVTLQPSEELPSNFPDSQPNKPNCNTKKSEGGVCLFFA